MNAAYLLSTARSNEKLERAGSAAAWYWVCSISYLRDKQEKRVERGEPIDFIPDNASLSLFADRNAREHVKALVKHRLWHVVDGGFRVNDYVEVYGADSNPAELQPDTPDSPAGNPADSKPRSSQLGGAARSESSRTPAGTFVPIQPATGLVSPRPPSSSEEAQKQVDKGEISESDRSGTRGSGRARGGRPKQPRLVMPAGFEITAGHLAHAVAKSWPEWWVRNRFDQFQQLSQRDEWKYSNWNQAFYVFLNNEISYRRGPKELAHLAPGAPAQAAGFRPRGPVQNDHGKTGTENARRR